VSNRVNNIQSPPQSGDFFVNPVWERSGHAGYEIAHMECTLNGVPLRV